MRAPIAYFAGAGTVIAAIGLGLGGGLTIANVMSPHQDKLEQTKLEQRMAAKPIPSVGGSGSAETAGRTGKAGACLTWQRRTPRSMPTRHLRRANRKHRPRRRSRQSQGRKRSARKAGRTANRKDSSRPARAGRLIV